MTTRERLLATFRYEPVDRLPDLEFNAWPQTLERWKGEGMPAEFANPFNGLARCFQTDDVTYGPSPGGNIYLCPAFENKILEEKGDHIIGQDGMTGAIYEMLRPELGASIPKYLRHALETKADWPRFRDGHLDPDAPGRFPADLEEQCRKTFDADYPTTIIGGSVYGWLRNWMGVENISIAIGEDPEWVGEMMRHLSDLRMRLYHRIAGKCKIDYAGWWEDMCFNKGPLVSPRFFHQYMVPEYKQATEFLRRECGCEFHMLDCDGNIHQLMPGWLEGGINVTFPVEVAHTDGLAIKREFGKQVVLWGYYDKRALARGKEAIDTEFARLAPLKEMGGFIPHTDHCVPPDVSWENYLYYRKRKCEFIGKAV